MKNQPLKESSSNKEDELVCLKAYHEEGHYEVTRLSYNKLLKLNVTLIKEDDKIEKVNINLKNYIEFQENSNEILRYELTSIRNQDSQCDTYVSMKNEVNDLHETLIKFTKERKPRFDYVKSKSFLE